VACSTLILSRLLVVAAQALAAQASPLPRDTITTNIIGTHETAQVAISYAPRRLGDSAPGLAGAEGAWSLSADAHAVLTTLLPLQVGTLLLDAGRYSIWLTGSGDHATLIFNRDAGASDTSYRATEEVGRVALVAEPVDPPTGALTIRFGTVRLAPDTLGVVYVDRSKARNHIETTRVTEHSGARRFLVIYFGGWKWTALLDAPGGS
jgi:hypothetical protein